MVSFPPRLGRLEDRITPDTVSWVVGSGDGNWGDASHWLDAQTLTNHVPGATDDAVINDAVTVTHASETGTVQSLSLTSGTLVLSGGTLTVSTTVSGSGTYDLKGGTLDGATVDSGTTITGADSGGTLNAVTFNSGSTLDLTGVSSANAIVTGGLTLNGTAYLGNASGTTYGFFDFRGPAQTLGGSGTVQFGGSASNALYGGRAGAGPLTIGPSILVHGTLGTVSGGDVAFTNDGTISADTSGGTITLSGSGWTNAGTLQASNGATLYGQGTTSNYSSGTLTGGTWAVFGNSTLRLPNADIQTNAATIVLDGANSNFYRDSGTTNALANFATNAAAGSFTVRNGQTFTTSGDLSNAGSLTVGSASTFAVTGNCTQTGGSTTTASDATFSGQGSVSFGGGTASLAGTYSAADGTSVSAGPVTFSSGANSVTTAGITLSGGTIGGSGTVTDTGSLSWTGGGSFIGGSGQTVVQGA
jgi:hypothetical protein